VRRTLFITLVVIVVVTGLPVLMNMGDMAACDFCAPGVLLPLLCLAAMVAAAVVLPALLRAPLRLQERRLRLPLVVSFFERPPQLV
jgi:SNF family Na+-dependent transporter